ncbi:viomycin phosphotransferase [Streptomyces sp. G45]|uniref:viomycin phosphotransferase n=1 Tax=Streptomyces sp. G45 TaxID=3406627 RepID=UPI003C1F42FD
MGIVETHRDLLTRLLPGDGVEQLAVHEGQFHHVVIGSDRVVCFPRTAAAAKRLPDRAALLHTLADVGIGFRTPRPLFEESGDVSRESSEGPGPASDVPYLVLSRVPGAPLAEGVLDRPEAAEAVARQYATLLSRLAEAGRRAEVRAALPSAGQGEWRKFAAGVRAELFPLMSDGGRRRAERELAALDGLPPHASAVVHGDLGGENVLWETVAGLPRLSGVVDWDEVGIGDPAEDLAAIGASHGDRLLDRVRVLGGLTGDDMSTRVAAIRATFALQQALSAARDGDEEELADGLSGYREG